MIEWKQLEKWQVQAVSQAVDRAMILHPEANKGTLHMDLCAAVIADPSINLDTLLKFDDENLFHDVFGIHRHINRATGELMDCFVPRCAS